MRSRYGVAGTVGWTTRDLFPVRPSRLRNPLATLGKRHRDQSMQTLRGSELEALADRFALNPGQISAAVAAAIDAQSFSDLDANAVDTLPRSFDAARAQSDQSLGSLAVKVKTIHSWDDLILPRLTLQRVKEITAAIRHRHVVYSEWGFEKRIAAGLGLKVLFSGASGTGKTMTAGVIARETWA